MKKVVLYTDGGARGNPGPAGAGAVIAEENGTVIKEVSEFLGKQTNNFAEYQAVILGLKKLKQLFGSAVWHMDIEVRLDSELIVRQLSGKYQIKEPTLFPQYIAVHNMRVKDFSHVTFRHIPREKNKEADRLANEAMDQA
ncbi:MAG TPA: ribonuclease HI family protein [Candidatus Paceibacterota bacterium]|jgi:ribonuclease HI